MMFRERTDTDYAIRENSIVYNLDAATVCFFARNTDDNIPSDTSQCLYSYAVPGSDNQLTFCTSPVLRMHLANTRR